MLIYKIAVKKSYQYLPVFVSLCSMSLISVKDHIGIPKYKQIVSSVEDALAAGLLKKGDRLPSINSVRNKFDLSRDTVMMAFNELKRRGIVESVSGKGYYIKSENINVSQKVFLLFDELNAFKEDLYNAFVNNLDEGIQVEIFFHHFSYEVFSKLIQDSLGSYHYYVIMPANLKGTEDVINILPEDKVYILDQLPKELRSYPSIHQNFEKDIFDSLMEAKELLQKYHKLVLLYSETKQPKGMLKGFQKFAGVAEIACEVIQTFEDRVIEKGAVYLVLDDQHLIVLIKKLKELQMEVGKDVGVISYNETLLKEIVEGGITTISTDFKEMGKRLAEMIVNDEKGNIENTRRVIIRNSL